jgi:hypothetical protein
MDTTERFAEFLAGLSDEDDPAVLDRLDNFIHGHLGPFSDHKWGMGSVARERQRLAAAFLEKAQDGELKQAILERILNLKPAD